jgi:hypothetical protein
LSQAQSAFSQLQNDAAGGGPGPSGPQAAELYVPATAQGQNPQGQNPIEEALQDYSQLANDIQNGDLTDADAAYSNLQQLVQAYQGPSASNSTIQNDFTTLGQDIQAGNVTTTQSAFTQFQSDLQAAAQPASATTTPTLTPAQQVQQDYAQLESALQSGNLSGAQSAFAALQQALQTQTGSTTSSTSTSGNGNDPIANALNNLGQALSSGNLSQAQSWFSQLQDDIQAAQSGTFGTQNTGQSQRADDRRAHGHHHHGGGWANQSSNNQSSTTSSANSYTASTTSSSVNVYA